MFMSIENNVMLVIFPLEDRTILQILNDAKNKKENAFIALDSQYIELVIDSKSILFTISGSGNGINGSHKSLATLREHYKQCKTIDKLIISFNVNEKYRLKEIDKTMEELYALFNDSVEVSLGVYFDNELEIDEVKSHVIMQQASKERSDARR